MLGDYEYINATSVSFVEPSDKYKENMFYTLFNTEVKSNTETIEKWKKAGYTYDEKTFQWTSESIKKFMKDSGLIWCNVLGCWIPPTVG
jgi:hypothetical protein